MNAENDEVFFQKSWQLVDLVVCDANSELFAQKVQLLKWKTVQSS